MPKAATRLGPRPSRIVSKAKPRPPARAPAARAKRASSGPPETGPYVWRANVDLCTLPIGPRLCLLLRDSPEDPGPSRREAMLQEMLILLWHSRGSAAPVSFPFFRSIAAAHGRVAPRSHCPSDDRCYLRRGLCREVKSLFVHAWKCRAAKGACEFSEYGCFLVREALKHYRSCTEPDCTICKPVREILVAKLRK